MMMIILIYYLAYMDTLAPTKRTVLTCKGITKIEVCTLMYIISKPSNVNDADL
uniref:Uncharacterized protein n=1 Tax=Rhizophora mucronata TaxID=61149 RepID=A0A2P2NJP2_RHIMU